MVPWKQMIGFEVLLLTNTVVILESTTYMVGTGSPSMTAQSRLTAVCWNPCLSETKGTEHTLPLGRCWMGLPRAAATA